MTAPKTYEQGVIEGKIEAIEDMQIAQNMRLKDHSRRISAIERVVYALTGIIVFIEFTPELRNFFGG